jgi:hypothetical protein
VAAPRGYVVIDQAKIDELTQRLDRLRESILNVPGVVGVGIALGDGQPPQPEIRVFVGSKRDAETAAGPLRPILKDLPFDVEVQGESYAFNDPDLSD